MTPSALAPASECSPRRHSLYPQVGARDAVGTGSVLPPRNEKVIRAGLGIIFEHLENGLWAPGTLIAPDDLPCMQVLTTAPREWFMGTRSTYLPVARQGGCH